MIRTFSALTSHCRERVGRKIGHARDAGRLQATVNIEEALRETELCFVAVATPSRPTGQIDPAHLFRACDQNSPDIVSGVSQTCCRNRAHISETHNGDIHKCKRNLRPFL